MTHPLLTDEQEPPGEWETGWVGGSYIGYRRSANGEESEHVIIQLQGERYGDAEERAVDVWTATFRDGAIPLNFSGLGETIGTGTGLSEGAEIALEFMEEQ